MNISESMPFLDSHCALESPAGHVTIVGGIYPFERMSTTIWTYEFETDSWTEKFTTTYNWDVQNSYSRPFCYIGANNIVLWYSSVLPVGDTKSIATVLTHILTSGTNPFWSLQLERSYELQPSSTIVIEETYSTSTPQPISTTSVQDISNDSATSESYSESASETVDPSTESSETPSATTAPTTESEDQISFIQDLPSSSSPTTGGNVTENSANFFSSLSPFAKIGLAVGVAVLFILLVAVTVAVATKPRPVTAKSTPAQSANQAEETFNTFFPTDHGTIGSSTLATQNVSNYGIALPGYMLVQADQHYRNGNEIAKGGFGRIMLGESFCDLLSVFGSKIIVKELTVSFSETRKLEMFYQEVSLMAFLATHKNIAKLLGYSENPFCIIMKFYPLGSLDKFILNRGQRKSKRQLFHLCLDIARGLEHMHRYGVVHADIKPPNVLLDTDEERMFGVLTDFGITQIFSAKSLLVGAFVPVRINGASLQYAAPEAFRNLRRQTEVPMNQWPFLDVYSYAIVVYEVVCRVRVYRK